MPNVAEACIHGNNIVDITTTWSGGWLSGVYGQEGRVVSDPDSITQHSFRESETHSTYESTETNNIGGPWGRNLTSDLTSTYEYDLDYARPEPPEGCPEGGADTVELT